MPVDPAVASAAIAQAGQFTNVGANTLGQVLTNRKNRAFSREMYERTKSDNIAFWNMQNEYNSPANQMKRFQEAGLNPHLIYGQGNSGNSSPVASPDVQSAQARAPEIDLRTTPTIDAFFDTQIKLAQLDNLKAQNSVITEEALLKAAQTRATNIGADRGLFDLDFETEHRTTSSDARRESVRQLRANIDATNDRNAREAAMNSSNLMEALERMKTMKIQRAKTREEIAQINEAVKNMKKDGVMKDLDIELYREGLRPTDAAWQRIAARALSSAFGTDQGSINGLIRRYFGNDR